MDRPIRLMTANLLAGRADLTHLSGILEQLEPDILVTQELSHDAAEMIGARFPHHYLRPADDARGRGIATRLAAEFGQISMPWRSGLWGRVELDPGTLLVANLHLRNPIAFPFWRSVRIRGQQLEALFAWADEFAEGGAPFVLAGDMNASPAWPVYKELAGRWDDLVADHAELSGEDTAPTWAWRPRWPRLLRIDHVFGRRAKAVSTRVEPMRGSDHAAVVVDLLFE
jgi:endonuclease/exonuclease/phosphatase family metal-dependent hydrolase